MVEQLKYLSAYPKDVQDKIQTMLNKDQLKDYLLKQYPYQHNIRSDKELRAYVINLKNHYLKKSAPLNQVVFDQKIHIIHNALGLHHYVSRKQGNKLKSKNNIQISSLFKTTPEAFLQMIAVHELAHLKEKEHNKAFYQLCLHMLPEYHQIEFDVRLYLTQVEFKGAIYFNQAPN